MKKITGTEFRSDYGFSSPNFVVDSLGNLTANSITTETDTGGTDADFSIFDNENGGIFIEGLTGLNPAFSIAKTQTTVLEINLDLNNLFLLKEDQETLLDVGLRHSSGDVNLNAQGKNSGFYSLNIPANFPEDTIYYTDGERSFYGEISVVDPVGIFSTLSITDTSDSISADQGALTVAGGIGIGKSISAGDTITAPLLTVSDISPEGDLNLNIATRISVIGSDSTTVGIIDNEGTNLPIKDTTVVNSSINNSTIGLSTPSSAKFTAASVSGAPVTNNDITNKSYVDTQTVAFSVVFGI